MTLEERIKQLFAESPQHKPAHLARHLNISRGAVSDWINGKTKTITGENAFGVAKFFNVNPEWVQTGHGKKSPKESEENKISEHITDKNNFYSISSKNEIELLQAFRKLTKDQQQKLINIAKNEALQNEQIINELKDKL